MSTTSDTSHGIVDETPSPAPDASRPGEVRGWTALLGWGVPIGMIVLGGFADAWTLWLWAPAFLIMGVTCVVNASRCGRLHCYLAGPLFLVAALLLALVGAGALSYAWVDGIGLGALIGVAVGYGAEWVLGRRYLHA